MDDLWTDLIAAWTPLAVPVALGSGIVLGETLMRLGIFRTARHQAWGLGIIGLLWYIPSTTRLVVDPASTTNVVRNTGGILLWFFCYATGSVVWRWLRERRKA